ncbi:hypothetical protein DYB32_000090 [Aphanomyces invadans]|uniref:HTH myb-type domain-containing protein n=1 Tax=Aphanomyces invadans TaxID=157072 RepID=A0A418BAZ6_9STRA|nr:hypothetical protein DYB32_000090 [Aphanomyces invadans]
MQVPRKMKVKKADKEVSESKRHAGTIQFEARQGRERTNSEETAMILTSMCMSSSTAPSVKASLVDGAGDKVHIKTEDGENDDETLINPGTKYIPSLARFDEADRAKYISSYAKFKDEEDGEGWSSDGSESTKRRNVTNAANRMKYHATKFISIEELREHFDQPIVEVARYFGICITLMKKVCRRNGIKRWPHRQIRSLTKSISSMEAAMMTATGAEREKYEGQIQTLKMKRDAVIADPNKEVSVSLSKNECKEEKKGENNDDMMLDENMGSDSSGSPRQNSSAGLTKDDALPPFILPATRPRPPPQQYEAKGGRWTSQEHAAFLEGIKLFGKNWRRVAQVVGTRNAVQTRTHAQKYLLKTSAHLDLHLALLKKESEDGDEVDEDANHAAFLTSLTTPRRAKTSTAPSSSSPPKEVVAGMDRLSSLMLKAESMHSHMLEASDSIRSPLDALNFSAPLLLSSSSNWNGSGPDKLPEPSGVVEPLRKIVLGRKAESESPDTKVSKKLKVEVSLDDNENLRPSYANVNHATDEHAVRGIDSLDTTAVAVKLEASNDGFIEMEELPVVGEQLFKDEPRGGNSAVSLGEIGMNDAPCPNKAIFHVEDSINRTGPDEPVEEPTPANEKEMAHNTFENDMGEFCPQI